MRRWLQTIIHERVSEPMVEHIVVNVPVSQVVARSLPSAIIFKVPVPQGRIEALISEQEVDILVPLVKEVIVEVGSTGAHSRWNCGAESGFASAIDQERNRGSCCFLGVTDQGENHGSDSASASKSEITSRWSRQWHSTCLSS